VVERPGMRGPLCVPIDSFVGQLLVEREGCEPFAHDAHPDITYPDRCLTHVLIS
jgi:hypothetical protein